MVNDALINVTEKVVKMLEIPVNDLEAYDLIFDDVCDFIFNAECMNLEPKLIAEMYKSSIASM